VIPGVQTSDERARETIRTDLDRSLLVEAAAGAGKTTELVNRIVAVLRTGRARVEQIVAVTFTHKAAGELKLRLRLQLDATREAASGQELDNLNDALARLEEASIGTIHSFCAQILRERPVEARVDPAFEDVAEQEQRRIYERAFRSWFERALTEARPGLRRALCRLAWRDSWESGTPIEQLRYAGQNLIEWRDFPTPWRREPFDREGELETLCAAARQIDAVMRRCRLRTDALLVSLRPITGFLTWIDRQSDRRTRDYDTIEALTLKLARDLKRDQKKGRGPFADGLARERVVEARDHLIGAIGDFKTRADAELAALLQAEMQDLVTRYEDLKRRAGKLDFTDQLIYVRDLLRNNREVREFLQQRFTHLFIDEFQDTDPLQSEILLLLASDNPLQDDWLQVTPAPGKLFIVGDPKQSIYKFRRADVLLYQLIRDRLIERGVALVYLSKSFRGLQPLQNCVNTAFEPLMCEDRDAGQAGYVPLIGDTPPIPGQPGVVALPAPRPWGWRGIEKKAINACLPDATAAFIEWLVKESGWQVRDPARPKQLAPLEARHIAVLFRRFINGGQDVTRDYVRSLEARDIPHLLVGSKSFHQREEVEMLRAACTAIEWPDDALSVYATLRGSFFAIPDHLLLRWRFELGRQFHPLQPRDSEPPPELAPIAEALDLLADLHWHRNRRPVADTLNRLLEATRAHAAFAMRPGGRQVLANAYRVPDLARTFELTGGISFRGFVDELAAQSDRSEASEAPIIEESADGVRLMTVHTAKGLEFPVVVLADMTANLAAGDPDRHIDAAARICATRLLRCAPFELIENDAIERARERAEGVRVAYVAATRARDLLVVPVVGAGECNGWLSPLTAALYPQRSESRRSSRADGCPDFGEATLLNGPGDQDCVRPGLHRPQHGEHEVVWWDPAALRLDIDAKFGLDDYDMLAGPADRGLAAYEAWKQGREAAIERGSSLQFEIFNPSESAEPPPGFEPTIQFDVVGRTAGRPSGRRFGTLVHAVLRDSELEMGGIEALAKTYGRSLGATTAEVDAAIESARTALMHPLIAQARTAERWRVEAPITARIDGRLLEGAMDLAFFDRGVWHIVDFKTDAHVEARRKHYEAQLRWYALALGRSAGCQTECHLLSV
jgi:ATP-dependent exoDNAse (exonuclease V) beta subunit